MPEELLAKREVKKDMCLPKGTVMVVNGEKRTLLPPTDMEKAYLCSESARLQAEIMLGALQQSVVDRQIATDALVAESEKQDSDLFKAFKK